MNCFLFLFIVGVEIVFGDVVRMGSVLVVGHENLRVVGAPAEVIAGPPEEKQIFRILFVAVVVNF